MKNHNPNQYPHESAGRILTIKVPAVNELAKVGDIESMLTKNSSDFDSIDYVYVLGNHGELKGVVSVREVFQQESDVLVSKVMSPASVTVRPYTDQERVALLALRHSLKAVPVVDKDNFFIGIVPHNAILKILDQEAVEDILRLGGVYQGKAELTSYDRVLELPITKSLKHRLPWLILGLIGGFVAAAIIGVFEHTLSQNLTLAAFIPLVVYMANAVGIQTEAFIIRELAVNPTLVFKKYFQRQFVVVALIGFTMSFLLYFVSLFIYHQTQLSFVLGTSLFIATLTSIITGLIIPYTFSRLKQDPANASGPIATILQDIISVIVYFGVAKLLLS